MSKPTTLTVSALNEAAKDLLESQFMQVLVTGEISNFSQPRSGHWYFTLKDEQAQIRAAMFKFRAQACNFLPKDGAQVLAYAKVSLYTPRGDYQLIVDKLEHAGAGALQQAFEQLKQSLHAAGWFDFARKKPLPTYPQTIGVITSPTGAALRDILSVLKRRCPFVKVKIFPTPVQGVDAWKTIKTQLLRADRDDDCDVLILARGGGSLEDLWSFNERELAATILQCQTPIVSGVGHETDFTIADFVADVRAPTPSAAAELVSPDQQELLASFIGYQDYLTRWIRDYLQHKQKDVALLRAQLKRPDQKLREWQQRLDFIDQQLQQAVSKQLTRYQQQLHNFSQRLFSRSPQQQLTLKSQQHQQLHTRLINAWQLQLRQQQHQLQQASAKLNAFSPLATLTRGYSITFDSQNRVIRSSKQLQQGDRLTTRFADGEIISQVLRDS
jgi:exodeoxyribonuclease VII large subunit